MVLEVQLVPSRVSLRREQLKVSAIRRLPAGSTATPRGALRRAVPLLPSVVPEIPASPQMVLDTQFVPIGDSLRMVWLNESATYMLPAPSTVMPKGELKPAPLFVPSAQPSCGRCQKGSREPASVVATQLVPTGVSFRMLWFPSSAT